jgi:hypothetical protein
MDTHFTNTSSLTAHGLPATLRSQAPDPADPYGASVEIHTAEAEFQDARARGDEAEIQATAQVVLCVAIAFGWPAAASALFTRTRSYGWAMVAVYASDGTVLREWEDEPDEMSDESENERVALFWASASDAACTWMPTGPALIPHGVCQQHFTLSVSTHGC